MDWDKYHADNSAYWLTGSRLQHIVDSHCINLNNYKNKAILDIGIGTGIFTKTLSVYTDKVYAADISKLALKKVSSFAKTYLTENLDKVEKVDLAICHLVFQHCTDEEVERIINDVQLKDNGIFSFQYAYFRDNKLKKTFSDRYIKLNETHFFRSQEKIREIITSTNKVLVDAIKIREFTDFNWETIRVKNE